MSDKVLHNTYLQVLVDSGIFALILFLTLVFGSLWWLDRLARKTRKTDPPTASMAMALFAAITTYAVGALFLSRGEFDYFYFLYMAVAVLYEVRKSNAALATAAPATGWAQGGMSLALPAAGYSQGGNGPVLAGTQAGGGPEAKPPAAPPKAPPVAPRMTARQIRTFLNRRGKQR